MTKYIIRRFIGLIPTLFIIITVSFFFIRLAPGGQFDRERKIPKAVQDNIERRFHLDEPLIVQYGRYMLDIMRGDLGPSFRYRDFNVNYYIFKALPPSALLGALALFLAVTLGVGVGMISAVRQNTWVDYSTMTVAIVGITVPTFVIGPVLMYIFAVKLKWLPVAGWIGDLGPAALILPVITLSFNYFAYIGRLSRASILEVLRSDYIRTAKAKGLGFPVIMFKHVLKGALLPVVSYLGPAFAAIITGSIIVEVIFRVPGLGRYFVTSALNRDYTMIMGTVIVYSVFLVFANFVVDIIYGFLDPRISYS